MKKRLSRFFLKSYKQVSDFKFFFVIYQYITYLCTRMRKVKKARKKFNLNGEHSAGMAELVFINESMKRGGIINPNGSFNVGEVTAAIKSEFPYISKLSVQSRGSRLTVRFIPRKFSREEVSRFIRNLIGGTVVCREVA